MAWVRPKHPKKKEPVAPVDPVEAFTPLLQYFSGRRPPSPTKSPSKKSIALLSHDPILQSFQQGQHRHEGRPSTSHSHKSSKPDAHDHHSIWEEEEDEDEHHADPRHERLAVRSISVYEREPSPQPPPPPPMYHRPPVRPKPRAASYERPIPRTTVRERDRYEPRGVMASLSRSTGEPPRAISARWASATTPLDIR